MAMEDIGGVPAVMAGNNDGYGGMGIIGLIAILALFGGGGFGFGRGEGLATGLSNEMLNTNMQAGFNQVTTQANFDTVDLALAGISHSVDLGNFNNIVAVKDAQYANTIATMNAAAQAAACCCETNRNIDAVRTQMAADTCAIINNQTTLAKDAELRDAYRMLSERDLALSEQRITSTIIATLQPPRPIPAYAQANPYSTFVPTVNLANSCGGAF